MAPLVKYAVSTVGDNPDPPQLVEGGFGGVGERFPNEGRRGLSEETFAAPPKPGWVSRGRTTELHGRIGLVEAYVCQIQIW